MSPPSKRSGREEALRYVSALHAAVDSLVRPLEQRHGERLVCQKGCAACCVDGLTVFDVEAEQIREHHRALLEQAAPHPEGRCCFLDDAGACRIYEHRPYVCRTQGLPLRWIEERNGVVEEFRDICPLNAESGSAVEALPPEDCWSIGPIEARLAAVQERWDGGTGKRVALRSLFAGRGPTRARSLGSGRRSRAKTKR